MPENLKIVSDGEGIPWCIEELDCVPQKGINFLIDGKVGMVQGVHLSGGCVNNPWSIRDLPNYISKLSFTERLSLVSLLRSVADRVERETGHDIRLVKAMTYES
jgi:hypothetical protein